MLYVDMEVDGVPLKVIRKVIAKDIDALFLCLISV